MNLPRYDCEPGRQRLEDAIAAIDEALTVVGLEDPEAERDVREVATHIYANAGLTDLAKAQQTLLDQPTP